MADSNQFLQRNKDFEATCAHEEARIIASHQVYVIKCLDPRTDPVSLPRTGPLRRDGGPQCRRPRLGRRAGTRRAAVRGGRRAP